MVASACPRRTRSPVSDTSSFWIQPAKRIVICASPRSFAATTPTVRSSPPIASRLTVAVFIPMSWIRSRRQIDRRQAGDGRGFGGGRSRRRRFAVAPPSPSSLGTRVMLQIGHWPGWSCTIDGCIGQV